MRMHARTRALALAAALATVVAGCGGSADGGSGGGDSVGKGEPLRIGLLLSLSGPAAPFGIPERDSIEVVADDINANGGVDGRPIELSVYDDGSEPTECARGATKLTREKKVLAIIGGTTGSCTLAAAPVAARNEVPMLAPNGTIEVTSPDADFYPYVFRTATNDLLNTKVLFNQAVEAGAKRLAVFFQEDAYGQNTAEYVKELAKEAGVEIVTDASAALDATDVTAQATRIRNAKPEAVLMQVSSPKLGAAFVRAAKQVGLGSTLWGGLGLAQKPFVDAGGGASEGVHLVGFGNWDEPAPEEQKLLDLLSAKGKKPAGFAELVATNGLLAITQAAEKAGDDLTGSALRDQLEGLCAVTTYARGELCYSKENHDGWGEDSLAFVVVENGKFVEQ